MSDQTITSLIEKLEGAEVGSRELDALINLHFHHDREYLWSLSGMNAQRASWKDRDLDRAVLRSPIEYALDRPVTISLDAALALAERVLDEPYPWVGKNRGAPIVAAWSCELVVGNDFRSPAIETEAATPALALCAAILRAQSEARV